MNQIIEEKKLSLEQLKKNFWFDLILNVITIVVLVFVIRTYIISPFQVFGPSMCDTLNYQNGECSRSYGEYIIVNKFGYLNLFGWKIGEPQRGDIIVFHPPHNQGEYFIKRVIGLAGETVKFQDGDIYIVNKTHPEGLKLEENYLNSVNKGNTLPREGQTEYTVPEGTYFVMGDNRKFSSDSRHCFNETLVTTNCKTSTDEAHFLPVKNIEGKAWIILWPFNKIGFIQHPTY